MKKTLATLGLIISVSIVHAELVQQFKDPTFSGNGWASQVLTIEQMRQGAQNSIDSKKAADAAAIGAAASNTPLAKFMALFTGQVYSQLATQLTNKLFKDCIGADCKKGDFMVSDTQKLSWSKSSDGTIVTLQVFDGKIVNGVFVANAVATQTINVPISSFSF
jgi:hypothetical protein